MSINRVITRQSSQAARPVFGSTSTRPAAVPVQRTLGRRELLQLSIALPFLASGPALADVTEAVEAAPPAPVVEASAAAPATAPAPSTPQPFLDVDFEFVPPPGFVFVDTQPPYDPSRRGPAPEPSPVRARFDAPDGSTVVSVLVRNAQSIKPSILQINDVSFFGDLQEAAKLLVPRGSRVLSASTLQVVLPPKQTTLGPVELPPKNYYRYEFTTFNGFHVIMTAAAMKGKVYVCGASTGDGPKWEQYGAQMRQATESFHLRIDNVTV